MKKVLKLEYKENIHKFRKKEEKKKHLARM